jgi:DNA-binding PadR family transcriptional regulator
MDLNRTAIVLLGMLTKGPLSGYDVKQLVQVSTRHFWNASYGQIYPELRRLEEAGLVTATSEDRGRRARTTYALTPTGRRALHDWLAAPGELAFELRDEGMLRLFFADQLEPAEARALLRRMGESYRARADELREHSVPVAEAAQDTLRFPLVTARLGIEFCDTLADWCERAERDV